MVINELTWDQALELFAAMPKIVWDNMRHEAVTKLNEEYEGSGHGISSSDVNHRIVPRLMRGHLAARKDSKELYVLASFSDDEGQNHIISLFVRQAAQEIEMELPYELPS